MKLVATRKADQNRAAVDPWTAVHLAAGLALGLVDAPRGQSIAAAVAYEVVEQAFERTEAGKTVFKTSGPEILANAVVDVVVFAAGHALGQRWNATAR